ncbi:MAG: redox-sensing transcriptional repressor Rex [Erysipelotrichales bacterium]|nr:redox-sensing transcriptional repressor Rex [Erysipelotrichales bacterium]MBQ2478843.1 redox-sensing transcriptional repressor Rex [Erysipelotrichales bacterium]MBQ4375503.1 redox-sensing transcriptional repressor Rex [Erysipelotrichales bacterium]MBQ5542352.1 redox-sensing transcriptional repressor Rex [Erysipelotrichales bacterium]
MSNNSRNVPKATLQRYPVYLKALRQLKKQGLERILSDELSKHVQIKSTTIRRDLSFLGTLGKQGYGYSIEKLIDVFNEKLGTEFDEKIILIGAGNLGSALMHYNRWQYVVGEIACAFDVDPEKLVARYDVPVYPMSELEERIPKGCRIAILTASSNVQATVDRLAKCGIVGIVDFTHEHIRVPEGVKIKQVDVVSAIQELVFETNEMNI